MMKHKYLVNGWLLLCVCAVMLTGCGSEGNGGHQESSNAVDKVLQDKTKEADDGTTSAVPGGSKNNADGTSVSGDSMQEDSENKIAVDPSVDYDLASMGSDMVYATVYQMMAEPQKYEGKSVRMRGTYYSNYYEQTGQTYFLCLIADAAACCKQGIEFIWGDGTHVYPDEYPAEESQVEVKGIFTTYMEGEQMYCHLENAQLTVLE